MFFSWKIWGVSVKNLHFKVLDASNSTSSRHRDEWEPLLPSHILAMIPQRFAPHFPLPQSGEAAQQSSPDSQFCFWLPWGE